jgi:hypothetical protein
MPRVEVTDSLLQYGIDYDRKKFYRTGPFESTS